MLDAMLVVGMWMGSAPAIASPKPRERERLERRVSRREARTEQAENRWASGFETLDHDPDQRTQRKVSRWERDLVSKRARLVRTERRLEALGNPPELVRVFFATNRDHHRREGKWFDAHDAGRIDYGIVTVHIPENHPRGEVERALSVVSVDILAVEVWREALADEVQNRAGRSAEVLTYVHGFNNSFSYAARKAAQLSHDLNPDVVPVLFSWPAHGGTPFAGAKYTWDENLAARSSLALADLLAQLTSSDVFAEPRPEISLMSHSLGARVVADALLDLEIARSAPATPRSPEAAPRSEDPTPEPMPRDVPPSLGFDQIVFAAPDIDAWVFRGRYLRLAQAASERVTVYCANDDRAIRLSRGVHGGYDRLGGCSPEVLESLSGTGVEVVDATKLHVNILDHSKVSSSPRLLDDLGLVLTGHAATDPTRALLARNGWSELPP